MPADAMPLLPLHQLAPGQLADCYALLIEKTPSVTRAGKPYLACRFRDAAREAACLLWAESPFLRDAADDWEPGTAYRLRVVYQEHPVYGAQIELHDWRPIKGADWAAGFDPKALIPSSRFDPEEMWSRLLAITATEIQDEGLRRLTQFLLLKWEARLKTLPASDGRYYPFQSGWLEHTLSLAEVCGALCDHYQRRCGQGEPRPNRDLLLSGAVLHDLGRALEHQPAPPGLPREPTVPGRLFGHVLLARDQIRDAARELGCVDPGLLERLEHLVLSHLTLPEWGSPRLPLIPEAILLHHADDLDAKLEMYLRCLRNDQGPGPFTASDPVLKKPLLKPGAWSEARVAPPEPA